MGKLALSGPIAIWLIAASASADAIGGPCPSGQIWQSNPVSPGAMHHGGGQCVPDPSASHCATVPGRAHGSGVAIGLALAIGTLGRRVRVRSR
jgi:cysteine sulfinate desulfinase/cysteine desulfurase-like protein